ncbi:hypothetical protein IKQ26_00595 [bacterium]|nr:hypothetical protein [bacterium]
MIYLLLSSISINIVTALLFLRLFLIKENSEPKQKAFWSSASGAFLLLYLISSLLIFICGIIKKDILMSSFVVFLFLPFIIGKTAQFETLRKYLLLQIISFIISLILLLVIFYFRIIA